MIEPSLVKVMQNALMLWRSLCWNSTTLEQFLYKLNYATHGHLLSGILQMHKTSVCIFSVVMHTRNTQSGPC